MFALNSIKPFNMVIAHSPQNNTKEKQLGSIYLICTDNCMFIPSNHHFMVFTGTTENNNLHLKNMLI